MKSSLLKPALQERGHMSIPVLKCNMEGQMFYTQHSSVGTEAGKKWLPADGVKAGWAEERDDVAFNCFHLGRIWAGSNWLAKREMTVAGQALCAGRTVLANIWAAVRWSRDCWVSWCALLTPQRRNYWLLISGLDSKSHTEILVYMHRTTDSEDVIPHSPQLVTSVTWHPAQILCCCLCSDLGQNIRLTWTEEACDAFLRNNLCLPSYAASNSSWCMPFACNGKGSYSNRKQWFDGEDMNNVDKPFMRLLAEGFSFSTD